jgi:hypothetical protein
MGASVGESGIKKCMEIFDHLKLASKEGFGSVQLIGWLIGWLVCSLVIQQSAPDVPEIATCQIDGEIIMRPCGNSRK